MNKQDNSTNKFELNYCNTEYYNRHPGCDCKPKQTPLEWHHWDDLYEFFRGYFNHFGDDISGLDKETFERMVKTIWRIANVRAVADPENTEKLSMFNRLKFALYIVQNSM